MITMETIKWIEKDRLMVTKYNKSTWEQMFKDYNANNEKRLSMNCRPCYYKVFKWHKDKLTTNT